MCVFVTGKNVVHDEKDLAQARSLSLSRHNLFACLVVVRSCLWKGNLYSSCVEIKRVSRGCRIVHASQAFQTTMLFPMVWDPQPLDMTMKNRKKKKKEKKNSPIFQSLYQEFLQESSIGKRWRRRTMYRKENKKLPWHTVWCSSCMIQLEKETSLSIEIALSCASCTWCSSLLWQQRPQLKQPERIWLCSIA